MSIRVDTQDLDNYPGTVKTVTVDQDSVVLTNTEGDEKYVLSFSTTAYSDNVNRTTIQDLYVTDFKTGWCKSSGFTGSNGRFALDSTHRKMKIKMDATISGSDGSSWYEITLDHDNGAYIEGASVAEDMEEKIRAIADSIHASDVGFTLAYKNASVEFTSGQFWIISGTVGRYYTGTTKTSVAVAAGSTNSCLAMLGFDVATTSEDVAGVSVKETTITSSYTAGANTLNVGAGLGVAAGDCLYITDGTNYDYFPAISGTTDTAIKVPIVGTNGFDGITHNYTYVAPSAGTGAIVQILRVGDPDVEPMSYYSEIDSITRFGIKSLVNQIDYSS
jgi:hypothetical protein